MNPTKKDVGCIADTFKRDFGEFYSFANLESVISGGNYVGGAAGEVGAVSLAGVLDSCGRRLCFSGYCGRSYTKFSL